MGAAAPALVLPDVNGSPVEIDGGRALLVFLPAAFTPVCGGELAGLVAIAPRLRAAGVVPCGIACDSGPALRTWAEQEGVPSAAAGGPELLSDFWPHGAVTARFEAFDDLSGRATRTSYLVDDGVVRWSVSSAPGVARDLDAHLAAALALAPVGAA